MKKLNFLSYCLSACLFLTCSGTKDSAKTDSGSVSANENTKTVKSAEMQNSDYIQLKDGESLYSFVGKKITFTGKISEIPMQHMMRMSPPVGEAEEHEYIEPTGNVKGGQIVAYYFPSKVKWPAKKDGIRFYGTMEKMSGAGKGGGEHTEYYLLLDKVE